MEKKCGCKATRSCLLCEENTGRQAKCFAEELKQGPCFVYCSVCGRAWEGWDAEAHAVVHTGGGGGGPRTSESLDLDGICVKEDFISVHEEQLLRNHIEGVPWVESQSGRRKQDFGPKVNFKKEKVRVDAFRGLPGFVHFVVDRFGTIDELRDFRPVELCHLQYDPERGSAIDPHLDDSWLWGARLVTLNLGTPTVLTLTSVGPDGATVRVPMNPRSLLVLSGEARYRWPHAVLREDVRGGLRWAMTFRELSSRFLPGGENEDVGRQLLERAKWILPV